MGVLRQEWRVAFRGVWIHILRSVGVGSDGSLVQGLGYGRGAGRSLIGLALRGRSTLQYTDGRRQTVHSGDVILTGGRSAFRSIRAPTSEEHLSLNFEFEDGQVTHPQHFRLQSPREAEERALQLARGIESSWLQPESPSARQRVYAEVTKLVDFLASEGLVAGAIDLRDIESLQLRSVSRALDEAFSLQSGLPMLVDIERSGGLSARTLQRHMPALCAALGQRSETFRAMRKRQVLTQAVHLMSHPKASTDGVSTALGFSSPTAFCRAVRVCGLPSPRRIQKHFADTL